MTSSRSTDLRFRLQGRAPTATRRNHAIYQDGDGPQFPLESESHLIVEAISPSVKERLSVVGRAYETTHNRAGSTENSTSSNSPM
jgi:hypothetical protein